MDEVFKGLGLAFIALWIVASVACFCLTMDYAQLRTSCIRLHYAEYDKEGNFVLVEKK